ncbi:hypothetical protein D3C85_1890210 [compost metagenome]
MLTASYQTTVDATFVLLDKSKITGFSKPQKFCPSVSKIGAGESLTVTVIIVDDEVQPAVEVSVTQ